MRRLPALLVLIGLFTLLIVPAAVSYQETTTDETVAEVTTDVVPALEQDLFIPAEEEVPDWTYRFLIPALIALTLAVVVGTTVQYFVRVVRPRYRPAE